MVEGLPRGPGFRHGSTQGGRIEGFPPQRVVNAFTRIMVFRLGHVDGGVIGVDLAAHNVGIAGLDRQLVYSDPAYVAGGGGLGTIIFEPDPLTGARP